MVSLMNTEEPKEISWWFDGSGTTFSLPVQCGEVVSFAKDSSFTDIIILGKSVQMEQATC